MFTSALPKEGKSTTIANLGVAIALAGKNVAIVDLDLHRPTQQRFFGLGAGEAGISSVVLGYADLDEALVSVNLERAIGEGASSGQLSRRPASSGSLVVLPTGPLPPDPGEFVGAEGVSRVIAALRERVDIVLVDAPPLLAVGDGLDDRSIGRCPRGHGQVRCCAQAGRRGARLGASTASRNEARLRTCGRCRSRRAAVLRLRRQRVCPARRSGGGGPVIQGRFRVCDSGSRRGHQVGHPQARTRGVLSWNPGS